MKKITKVEARERKAAWAKGLSEGRIVAVGLTFTMYPTVERAAEALALALRTVDSNARIVREEK